MENLNVLVTGVARFIGSHLAESLVSKDYNVVGMDSFEDYYPRWIKENNLDKLLSSSQFKFIEGNLLELDLHNLFKGIDYIFHQAAQAGVRSSWGKSFIAYTENNILATQRLLEEAKNFPIKKFIYASSSSVYGDVDNLPMEEDDICRPISPYGVSKLAAEHLCYLYWKNFKVPTVSLRYFTVYGPRQRLDMAFHKFTKAILENREIEIYGDGNQIRDFTYVLDVVNASILAMSAPEGEIFNIGGGSTISLKEAVELIEGIVGKKAKTKYLSTQKGNVRSTWALLEKAKNFLDYKPKVKLEEGLRKEIDWIKKLYA